MANSASKGLNNTKVIQVPLSAENPSVAALNDPTKLILISKRSTADSPPEDTPHARQVGCILYLFTSGPTQIAPLKTRFTSDGWRVYYIYFTSGPTQIAS
jgi:hypothetical protein